jgi:hypothetical protein
MYFLYTFGVETFLWVLVLTPFAKLCLDALIVVLKALIVRYLPPRVSTLLVRNLLKR